jgi:hypothetical protein
MEVEIKNVNEKLDKHCSEQRQDFDKVFNKLDNLDGKFASKWVEKVAVGSLISILTALIGAIVLLI